MLANNVTGTEEIAASTHEQIHAIHTVFEKIGVLHQLSENLVTLDMCQGCLY